MQEQSKKHFWIFLLLKNIEIFIFIKAHFGVANQRIPFFEMWSSACFKGSSKMTPFEVQKWNGHDNGKVGISGVSGLSLKGRVADIERSASPSRQLIINDSKIYL